MTYQIDTIVKNQIVNTEVTNSVDQAIYYVMKSRQYCLTSICRIYTIINGEKTELKW